MTTSLRDQLKLICPSCRSALKGFPEAYVCTGAACRLAFAVVDNIPILITLDGIVMEDAEWRKLLEIPGEMPQSSPTPKE